MCALFFFCMKHHCMKDRWLFPFSKHLVVFHKQEINNFSGLLVMYRLYLKLMLYLGVDECL